MSFITAYPAFDEAFQEHMKERCLDGKKRIGRELTDEQKVANQTKALRRVYTEGKKAS